MGRTLWKQNIKRTSELKRVSEGETRRARLDAAASRASLQTEKLHFKPFDFSLLFVTLILVFFGVVMVFSSSAMLAKETYHDTYYFLKKELVYVTVGLIALFTAKSIPYRIYWNLVYPFLGVMIAMLLVTLAFGTGGTTGEVHRWLRLGPLSLQPSEMSKLVVVIFTAYALAKKGEKIRSLTKGYLPIMGIASIFIVLVLAQRDLGSAFILAVIVFIMLFVAGTRASFLIGSIVLSLPLLYLAVFAVDFRRQRIMAFLDPWKHQLDYGFQIIQSFVAFKSGGLTGVGLGEGKQKLFYLPEAHTDFIFSVVGEELGLVGVLAVIAFFTYFIFRGLMLAMKTRDPFGMYLAFGITCLIGIQAYFNVGVVMGLFPTKGLALPFISYGGSSLLTNLIAVGILLNISTEATEDS